MIHNHITHRSLLSSIPYQIIIFFILLFSRNSGLVKIFWVIITDIISKCLQSTSL